MDNVALRDLLIARGIKVTPQRMAVLDAVYQLDSHPTAEQILEFVRQKDATMGSGTIYKVLETLVEHNLLKKVKTEKDVMRYDGTLENHHHLYCIACDYIEDFHNEKLDQMLAVFFEENKIDNFQIEDIKVNITGNFIVHRNKIH